MIEPFRVQTLDSGLVVKFYDVSNRYFGDFHRVCIEVKIDIPVIPDQLPAELASGVAKLGGVLCFERRLERMGVTGGELLAVTDKLIADFLATSCAYLNKPDFAQRLIKRKLTEKSQQSFLRD